jgi:ATP-dependent Clp protease ATP-binding subunit ClpA
VVVVNALGVGFARPTIERSARTNVIIGRCSVEANSRYLDVRNVIWLGTSNIGHDLIFQHHETRQSPNELMSREEYLALTGQLRPCVSERLGVSPSTFSFCMCALISVTQASLLSRVTTVLPFVPFSLDEKKAVAAEALYTLAGERLATLPPPAVESLVLQAVSGYIPAEGARSLYRAVSSQLIDCI